MAYGARGGIGVAYAAAAAWYARRHAAAIAAPAHNGRRHGWPRTALAALRHDAVYANRSCDLRAALRLRQSRRTARKSRRCGGGGGHKAGIGAAARRVILSAQAALAAALRGNGGGASTGAKNRRHIWRQQRHAARAARRRNVVTQCAARRVSAIAFGSARRYCSKRGAWRTRDNSAPNGLRACCGGLGRHRGAPA